MHRFFKNTKGAVTVFVTLLLIPAVLVSGTAVDLARIHTARSIVQDANQLAANSVLTQYNALLYDLYALFGVAEDDPILAQLLDEYISVSVFGEPGQDRTMGTLQLFYGSNITLEEPQFAEDKHLRNEDVLRRQIEEYMKFRAPVIIVKDLLELIGSSTFKEDTGVINDKLEIEKAIADLYEKYKELYEKIIAADMCNQTIGGIVGGTVGTVSARLEEIREQFANLKDCYEAWEDEEDESVKNDLAEKYSAILVNIKSRTIGGAVGSNWSNGRWQSSTSPRGLNVTIENAKNHADNWKPKFDDVVTLAIEIDSMNSELRQKVDELDERLKRNECNEDLKAALTERTGSPPKSIIERYRDILKWDSIEDMANISKDGGYQYIDDVMKPLLDDVIYRNRNNSYGLSLTREQLENILANPNLSLSSSIEAANSYAAILGGYKTDDVTYKVPPGFKKFGDHPGGNKKFFEELKQMMNQPNIPPVKLYEGQGEASGGNAQKKQRNLIDELLNLVNSAYEGLANNPLGAKYIKSSSESKTEALDMLDITSVIPQAMNEPVSNVISDPYSTVASMGDYLLLLTYCTSVFSNYTSAKPESAGKKREEISDINFPKSITGVPMSPEVNYFFQSEWEYLYNGDENAANNLSSVTRLIFVVRLICNYITVFSVSEVTSVITSIRTAFSWNPPLALVLGELARAAFVAAESATDVATLRAGYKVPLIKKGKSGEWVCSPSGLATALANVAADMVDDGKVSNDKGITYSNYLMFFFLSKAVIDSDTASELTKRTANMIEWNVINYKNGVFSDEEKMAGLLSAEDRFKLEDMKTDFSLTTTVDMRMLFLSMLFARDFSDSRGIGMPSTMPVTVTDHRGY